MIWIKWILKIRRLTNIYVGPSMALTTSFYVIWQVISVYVKKMCGNGNQTFKKQDLQNYQVYITLK
ncbi:hypothetical protein Hanom_Chr16g01457821 [Helianthus anomalus]